MEPKAKYSEVQGRLVLLVVNISSISLAFSGLFGRFAALFPQGQDMSLVQVNALELLKLEGCAHQATVLLQMWSNIKC